MGLLNFEDPQSAGMMGLAQGLLAASGPSAMPVSMGQAIASGIGSSQAAYKSAMEEKRMNLQQKMLEAQLKMATQKDQMLQDLLKGDGVTTGQLPAGQIQPSSALSVSGQSSLYGVPRQAMVADIALNGGKNVGEWMFKRGVPNMQVHGGVALDMNSVNPGFLPQVNVSQNGQASVITPNPGGGVSVSAPNGALDVYKGYQNAEQSAKAAFDPVTYTPPGGQPTLTTRANVVGAMAPSISSQDQAAIDAFNKAGRPNTPWSMSVGGLPVQSAEEAARTTAAVQVDSERAKRQAEKGQGQENLMIPLTEIGNRLRNPEYVLGNTPADRAKMLGHEYGMQSRASINTARIRELANQLTLANGSLGAGVSNADRDAYEKAQGRLTEAKSHADMVDAVDTMKRIASKYQERDVQVQQELRTGKRSSVSSGGWSAVAR